MVSDSKLELAASIRPDAKSLANSCAIRLRAPLCVHTNKTRRLFISLFICATPRVIGVTEREYPYFILAQRCLSSVLLCASIAWIALGRFLLAFIQVKMP